MDTDQLHALGFECSHGRVFHSNKEYGTFNNHGVVLTPEGEELLATLSGEAPAPAAKAPAAKKAAKAPKADKVVVAPEGDLSAALGSLTGDE